MMDISSPYVKISTKFFNTELDNWFEKFITDEDELLLKKDKEGNSYVEIEVPGFNSDNLEVTLDKGFLTIFGDDKEGRQLNKSVFLGNNVKEVNGSVKDGLLKVYLETKKDNSKKVLIKQE
jgi:HSP20 family molecular chaperone IbpA